MHASNGEDDKLEDDKFFGRSAKCVILETLEKINQLEQVEQKRTKQAIMFCFFQREFEINCLLFQ